jgi:hypoxanthine phosphoribosyltransferase
MSTTLTPHEARRAWSEADLIHGPETVAAAYDAMAADMTGRLEEANPLVVGVMVGGVVPLAELVKRLPFPLEIDYLHASRYQGETRGGDVHWVAMPQHPLEGRTVVLVDDILDEGVTLAHIRAYCFAQGAREVRTAVLVHKDHDRKPQIKQADYSGLRVPDRYVFGCGMDYRGYLRNVPGVYAVKGL